MYCSDVVLADEDIFGVYALLLRSLAFNLNFTYTLYKPK